MPVIQQKQGPPVVWLCLSMKTPKDSTNEDCHILKILIKTIVKINNNNTRFSLVSFLEIHSSVWPNITKNKAYLVSEKHLRKNIAFARIKILCKNFLYVCFFVFSETMGTLFLVIYCHTLPCVVLGTVICT